MFIALHLRTLFICLYFYTRFGLFLLHARWNSVGPQQACNGLHTGFSLLPQARWLCRPLTSSSTMTMSPVYFLNHDDYVTRLLPQARWLCRPLTSSSTMTMSPAYFLKHDYYVTRLLPQARWLCRPLASSSTMTMSPAYFLKHDDYAVRLLPQAK